MNDCIYTSSPIYAFICIYTYTCCTTALLQLWRRRAHRKDLPQSKAKDP